MSSLPDRSPREVDDEENRSQAATIRRIQSYRDDIADYQRWFAQNEISGSVSKRKAHASYHQLAKGYLQILTPYLTDPEIAQDVEHPRLTDVDPMVNPYWSLAPLGSFSVDPPSALQQPDKDSLSAALRNGDRQTVAQATPRISPEPKQYTVNGLREFAGSDPEWTDSWTIMFGPEVRVRDLRQRITDDDVEVEDRQYRNEPITVTKQARVPKTVIDNAIRNLEQFVRELGLDINLKEAGMREFGFSEVTDVED